MAQKSANLYVRIEPELKEQAENILAELGISASGAINMFYKQIILRKGIPFDVVLPSSGPLDFSHLSREELSDELEKGYADIEKGNVEDAASAFVAFRERH